MTVKDDWLSYRVYRHFGCKFDGVDKNEKPNNYFSQLCFPLNKVLLKK